MVQTNSEALPAGFVLHGSDREYTVRGLLGTGGFGMTYVAADADGNEVAVKELFPSELSRRDPVTGAIIVDDIANIDMVARLRQRFISESNNVARCRHRSIVRVYDTFQANGTAYMVMELVRGENLKELVRRRHALDYATTTDILREVASALAYLHSHGIVHLDVKPDNIILGVDGRIVLIDFGLSRSIDRAASDSDPVVAAVSHGYAAPEQYELGRGAAVRPCSDVYSLAATAVKMLTGNTPPRPEQVRDHPECVHVTGIPAYADAAIRRAMAYDMSARTASVGDFFAAFSDAEHTAIIPERPRRRHSVVAIVANVVAIADLAFAALLAFGDDRLLRLAYYFDWKGVMPYAVSAVLALSALALRRGAVKVVAALMALVSVSYVLLR